MIPGGLSCVTGRWVGMDNGLGGDEYPFILRGQVPCCRYKTQPQLDHPRHLPTCLQLGSMQQDLHYAVGIFLVGETD